LEVQVAKLEAAVSALELASNIERSKASGCCSGCNAVALQR